MPSRLRGQAGLRIVIGLHGLGVVQLRGSQSDGRRLGPRFDDLRQDLLFAARCGLDRLDQVADQVVAALVLGLEVRELGVHLLFGGGHAVEAATGQRQRGERRQDAKTT